MTRYEMKESPLRLLLALSMLLLAAPAAPAAVTKTTYKGPLAFEANAGHLDEDVRFVSRNSRSTLFLTEREARLSLKGSRTPMRLTFPGGRASGVSGRSKLAGVVNSYVGDRSRWRSGVATYRRAVYEAMWPGIDVAFHGDRAKLEYDFVVAPGADPSVIRIASPGARRARIARSGDLLVTLRGGRTVRQAAPVSYQTVGGERRAVASRYVRRGSGFGIAVGAYDRGRTLVIDPTILYSTYLGGDGTDQLADIAIDPAGYAYVVGYTGSTDYPQVNGNQPNTPGTDVVVTKLNQTGTGLVYSTYLGGNNDDRGYAIALDGQQRATVTGFAGSTDFPVTAGLGGHSPTANADVFAARFSPTGTLEFSAVIGAGDGSDSGYGVAIGPDGAFYVTGSTSTTSFPTSAGAYDTSYETTNAGTSEAFVVKFSETGLLTTSTLLGGTRDDFGSAIVADATGVYVGGSTNSAEFPTTPQAPQSARGGVNGMFDGMAVKLSLDLSSLVFSTYFGGSGDDDVIDLALDPGGSLVLAGATGSADLPFKAGAHDDSLGGAKDGFVAELTPDLSSFAYATHLGGGDVDRVLALGIDPLGNVYVTGETASTNFPTVNPIQTDKAGTDAFVTTLGTGGAPVFSTYLGGGGGDTAWAIAVDKTGAAYVTGATGSAAFPTSPGAYDTVRSPTSVDGFVTKISGTPTAVRFQSASARRTCAGARIAFKTGRSADTLGFDVFRGKRVKVNRRLLTGGALGGGGAFAVVDRKGRPGDRYWIRETSPAGKRTWHGPFTLRGRRPSC
jgi:hypothetical protein